MVGCEIGSMSEAGCALSEFIRRRRMTVAAADVIGGRDLLWTSVRFGYGSTMRPACRSFTTAQTRTFSAYRGAPAGEHLRLKVLSNTDPAGLLQVRADVDPDYTEAAA